MKLLGDLAISIRPLRWSRCFIASATSKICTSSTWLLLTVVILLLLSFALQLILSAFLNATSLVGQFNQDQPRFNRIKRLRYIKLLIIAIGAGADDIHQTFLRAPISLRGPLVELIASRLATHTYFLLNQFIRSRQHIRRNRQTDLFGGPGAVVRKMVGQ